MRSHVKLAHRFACLATVGAIALGSAAAGPVRNALHKTPEPSGGGAGGSSRAVVLIVSSETGRVRTMKWVCIRCVDVPPPTVSPAERTDSASGGQSSTGAGLDAR
jgi:hypothetical protein